MGDNTHMDSKSFRKAHLQRLVREYGSANALAIAAGVNQGNLSLVLSGKRGMGANLARKLEKFAGYPEGYMDLPPEQAEAFHAAAKGLSDDDLIAALRSRIPHLSKKDAQALSLALLERLSQ